MTIGIGTTVGLRPMLSPGSRPLNLLLGISPLELEMLLDKGVEAVRTQSEESAETAGTETKGQGWNFYRTHAFYNLANSVRGKVPSGRYLTLPLIFVREAHGQYSASFNRDVVRSIEERLGRFTREHTDEPVPVERLFSVRFQRDWEWIRRQQELITAFVCDYQKEYLKSMNAFDLRPMGQQEIADRIRYSLSTVCRLVKNLSMQLPDNRVAFVHSLIPGYDLQAFQGIYALGKLRQNPDLFHDRTWLVSDETLMRILRNRFGFRIARRTVNKHKRNLERIDSLRASADEHPWIYRYLPFFPA